MITIKIEIDLAPTERANEFGAGVLVHAEIPWPKAQPEAVGATYVGICTAINDYMRSRGCPNFDCLKQNDSGRRPPWC